VLQVPFLFPSRIASVPFLFPSRIASFVSICSLLRQWVRGVPPGWFQVLLRLNKGAGMFTAGWLAVIAIVCFVDRSV
jgi:hypothetical protein